jgi:Arc/MetJ family transcription regulator
LRGAVGRRNGAENGLELSRNSIARRLIRIKGNLLVIRMGVAGLTQWASSGWRERVCGRGGIRKNCGNLWKSQKRVSLESREMGQAKLERGRSGGHTRNHTPNSMEMVYAFRMGRTNIEIDESLVRKARKLTRLKTKREIVDAALELLVRSESRKGILRHYGTGIWKGDLKAMRRNRG